MMDREKIASIVRSAADDIREKLNLYPASDDIVFVIVAVGICSGDSFVMGTLNERIVPQILRDVADKMTPFKPANDDG